MVPEEVLSLILSRGFLSPRAARFAFLGKEKLVFMAALPHGPGSAEGAENTPETGRIAPFAQRNYYRAAVLQLKKVVGTIISSLHLEKRDTSIFCNSRLPEKAMAAACGVGTYGKNGLILVPGTGSLCVLAGFSVPSAPYIHSIGDEKMYPPLSTEPELQGGGSFSLCGSCSACRDACPTNALSTPGSIDRQRCIQNFTAERSVVPEEIMDQWGGIIYGCQHCQDACPLNRDAAEGFQTREGEIGAALELMPLLSGGPEAVQSAIRSTVMDRRWIHPEALFRNVLIAAGSTGQSRFTPFIQPYVEDSRPFIRYAAAWAYRKTTSTES